jgi:hypothetical protein
LVAVVVPVPHLPVYLGVREEEQDKILFPIMQVMEHQVKVFEEVIVTKLHTEVPEAAAVQVV